MKNNLLIVIIISLLVLIFWDFHKSSEEKIVPAEINQASRINKINAVKSQGLEQTLTPQKKRRIKIHPKGEFTPSPLEELRDLLLRLGKIKEDTTIEDMLKITKLNFTGADITNDDLYSLRLLPKLKWLSLKNTDVSDLSPLANLKELTYLSLRKTAVSDISPLANLQTLSSLTLNETSVSDLSPLANLQELQTLLLSGTDVSDISVLAELQKIEKIYLNKTPVSDIRALDNLPKLSSLHLRKTSLDEQQLQELKEILPKGTIKY